MDAKLETLLMVHETGNYTRAAKHLSLTQPAVSQHIKQLEGELGVKLFNRSSGELRLTTEGEIVLKYAKRIRMLQQNLRRSLADKERHITRIAVGVTHTFESNIVAEVLAKYCNQNKGVCISIISDTINNLYEKLKTYELDIAITDSKIYDDSFNSILLDTDCLVLAVSINNPLSKKSMVTLGELKNEPMILRLPNSGTRDLFISHLKSNNESLQDFNVILEVDNIATIKDLIRRDFGVSILAKSTCLDEIKKGKLKVLPVENLSMTRETNIIYPRDFEYTDILNDITEMYYETVRHYAP